MGVVATEAQFFFGHATVAPRGGRYEIPMDAAADVQERNVIVIRISDYDARTWGRRFDIALVTGVTRVDGEKAFRIKYYAAVGVRPGRHVLGTDEFVKKEKRAIDGQWSLTDQVDTTFPQYVMCFCWINDDGTIHDEYKHRLQEAILAHESL